MGGICSKKNLEQVKDLKVDYGMTSYEYDELLEDIKEVEETIE